MGSSGKVVGPGTVVTIGGFLMAERASKNAGSRELFSALALPEKNARHAACDIIIILQGSDFHSHVVHDFQLST